MIVSDRIKTRSSRAILFDVLDAEAITKDAVGPPAINTKQSIETKISILQPAITSETNYRSAMSNT